MVKKEGSTLVTVLGVTVVFMTLAVTIFTSIMGTMKANNSQKVREDLKYAAESGLEIARSYLNGRDTITKGDIDTINDMLKKTLVDTNNDGLPDSEVGKVELVSPTIDANGNIIDTPKDPAVTGKSEKFTVRIRAEKKDETDVREYAGVNYSAIKGGTESIFKYGVVSGNGGIEIESAGSVDIASTTIAGPQGEITLPSNINGAKTENQDFGELQYVNTEYTNEIVIGDLDIDGTIKGSTDGVKYTNLETDSDNHIFYRNKEGNKRVYKYYDVNSKKQLAIDKVILNLKTGIIQFNGKKITLEELKTKSKKSIVHITMQKDETSNSTDMKLISINSGKVRLETGSNTVNLLYESLITKGDFIATGKGAMTVQYATVFANKVYISKDTSITVSFQASKEPDLTGHGTMTDAEEKRLNEILNTFIPNWNKETGLTGGGMGLKEDTFSN
ncbi:MAG: hypothetical protein ACRC30_03670 [Clostridium sp.]